MNRYAALYPRRLKPALYVVAVVAATTVGGDAQSPDRAQILSTMKRATTFMVEKVSTNGGFVWNYLPDLSRRWGELEARPTQIWIQPPGTATMGHLFLDAYHATGDEYYYQAAEKVAGALIWGQHPSGGWNYMVDFGGDRSLRRWYDTIGKNAWRMEEFQHYWGNATFDDAGTAVASQFLLRMYLERREARYLPAVQKAIDFVLNAQFGPEYGVANGGWPQRFPHFPGAVSSMPLPNASQLPAGAKAGMDDGDYTLHVTFNDDVMGENIKFLTMCVMSLGMSWLVRDIRRAMDCMKRLQQPVVVVCVCDQERGNRTRIRSD